MHWAPAHWPAERGITAAAHSGIFSVERGDVLGLGPPAVRGRLRPPRGRILPFLLPAVGQQVDEREGVAELLGAAAVGVPGAVDGVAVAQEHVDRESATGRRADV